MAAGRPRRRPAQRRAGGDHRRVLAPRAARRCSPPYVERYFAEVAEVWERRTSERAQSVVVGLFPAWAVDKPTVDAADALARRGRPPARPAQAGVGGPGRDRAGAGRAGVRPPVALAAGTLGRMTAADPARCSCPARCDVPWPCSSSLPRSSFTVLAVRYAGTSTAGAVDTRVDAVVDPLGCRAPLAGPSRRGARLARRRWSRSRSRCRAMCLLLGRRRLARAGRRRAGPHRRLHDAAQARARPHHRRRVRLPERPHRWRDVVGAGRSRCW